MITGFYSGKIQKIKKYLFFISILFLVSTFSHILYSYLYSDSELLPEKGGTISEGIIGEFPSFNPLKTMSGNNEYIMNLLYRSIMKYDIASDKIVSDLAVCDTSNLLYIDCYLKDNIKWSNDQPITNEDVIATYKLLQNTTINPVIASLLSETKIEEKDNHITFTNPKKDINFLNIFFQPILSSSVIDKLSERELSGNFNTSEGIYSGNFILTNISRDETIGFTKIIFEKNPNNIDENIYIDTYIVKLFSNANDLLKNKESINIYHDINNFIGESVPRLESYEYTLPQYVSLFLNKNTIVDQGLRNFILQNIKRENLLKILGDNNFKQVNNPYLSSTTIDGDLAQKNFEEIMEDIGYERQAQLLSKYIPEKEESTYSEEVDTEPQVTFEDIQEASKTITGPAFIKKYNFVTGDNILLTGITNSDTQSVYINDYKLKGYSPGNTNFHYRVKESFKNIQEGKNTYKVYFTTYGSDEKVLQEEIIIFYNKDLEQFDTYKNELISALQEEQIIEQEEEQEKITITAENFTKVQELDERYYYHESFEPFALNLSYLATEKDIQTTAEYIKDALEKIGVKVDLTPIPLQNIGDILADKNSYDMILGGIHLGYFSDNIFPYFHSSQAENGYNFSNIRRTILDDHLESLKSKIQSPENIEKLQMQVLEMLQEEQVLKTLYTPKMHLLVDKNMNSEGLKTDFLPNKSLRSELLYNTYVKEKKIMSLENKGIMNFIGFLVTRFYDPSTER